MHTNRSRWSKQKMIRIAAVIAAAVVAIIGGSLVLRILGGSPKNVLPGIRKRGTITIGVTSDTAPLGYIDANGSLAGFEADLARAIGGEIVGERSVVLVPVTNRTRAAKLDYGHIDFAISMISNVSANQERYHQSDAYYTDPITFLTRSGKSITADEDLSGKKIAVFQDSIPHNTLKSHVEKWENPPQIIPYTSFDEIKGGLGSAEVDLVCAENSVLRQFGQSGYTISSHSIGSVSYAITIRKNENDLYQEVQNIVNRLKDDGTLTTLYNRYGLAQP
ncbi:MAG: transporter substrate-binding domain-containing protein [Clostridiales bacterium]|nr:transporter substrate-binding domain-containing protein [Clostridiales bacterium]